MACNWVWCESLTSWVAAIGPTPLGYTYPAFGSSTPDLGSFTVPSLGTDGEVDIFSASANFNPCNYPSGVTDHASYSALVGQYETGPRFWGSPTPGIHPAGAWLFVIASGPNYDASDPKPTWDPVSALDGVLVSCPPVRRPKPSLNGRLGCGTNSAFITSKGGAPRKGSLTGGTSITYDRRLDDISLAEVVVHIGGSDEENCCELLADIEPWCDELHIERNGVEVWVGPVTEVIYSFKQVVVRARDILFWLQVRILQSTIDTTLLGTGPEDLTTTAMRIINDAYAGNDPANVLAYVHQTPSGTIGSRLYNAFGDTDLNYFTSLSATGVNFTAIGRTIIIGGKQLQLNSIATLTDLMILSDVSVNKTGLLQGNRIYEHFTGDAGAPAVSEVPFQCYGRIEQVRTDDLPDHDSAQQTADAYAAAVGTAPRILEVASGGDAALSPETPWDFMSMIPGVQVTVFLTRLCVAIEDRYQLTFVQVQQSGDHLTEVVTIRLGTVNPITGKL